MNFLKNLGSIFYALFFRKHNFYCEIHLGDMLFKIWEKPGRWLSEKAVNQLLSDIQQVAVAGQNGKEIPNYGVLEGNRSDLNHRFITLAHHKKTNQPIGFSAQVFLEVPVQSKIMEILHLGLVFVDKAHQQKSVVGLLYVLPNLVLLMKRRFRPIWVSNVTQVPCVVGMFGQYYDAVYPNPLQKIRQTYIHKTLFEGIMKEHRAVFGTAETATFDIEQQIIYDSYTGGSDHLKKTYQESTKSRHDVVNSFCKVHLDYGRGDDFVQIGKLSMRVIYIFCLERFARFKERFVPTSAFNFLKPTNI